MRHYEIRFVDSHGLKQIAMSVGSCGMDAAERAVEMGLLLLNPNAPVYVIAINTATGVAVKFEMAMAS